jgi:hypothetical protein
VQVAPTDCDNLNSLGPVASGTPHRKLFFVQRRNERMTTWNLRQARKYGVALLAAAAGVGIFISEIHRIIELPPSILNYGYLSCFFIVGALVIGWIWATDYELGLEVWLYPKKKRIPSGTKETAQVILIGLVLIALFYSARNPLLFSGAFTVYSSVVCLLVFRMNTLEIPPLFADSLEHLYENPENWSEEIIRLRIEAISILDLYFLRQPHTPRHILILDAAFVACLIALYGQLKNSHEWGFTAYAIIFSNILVSEIVIFSWRIARDKKLKQIDESLRNLGHDIEKMA